MVIIPDFYDLETDDYSSMKICKEAALDLYKRI